MTDSADSTVRRVSCPSCHSEVIWSASSPFKPFCSQRCQDMDFLNWSEEKHVLQGSNSYSDVMSEDSPFDNDEY